MYVRKKGKYKAKGINYHGSTWQLPSIVKSPWQLYLFINFYVYNEHNVGFIFSKIIIIIMYGLYTKKPYVNITPILKIHTHKLRVSLFNGYMDL